VFNYFRHCADLLCGDSDSDGNSTVDIVALVDFVTTSITTRPFAFLCVHRCAYLCVCVCVCVCVLHEAAGCERYANHIVMERGQAFSRKGTSNALHAAVKVKTVDCQKSIINRLWPRLTLASCRA
jgi:hypothetical protein